LLSLAVAGCGGGQPGAESAAGGDTTDVTPPTVIAKFPNDQQTSVPLNTVIAVTFSEAMNVRRLDLLKAQIGVFQAKNGLLEAVQTNPLVWEARSNTLFITPTTLLAANTHFTVTIYGGFIDPAGNPLDTGTPDGVVSWRFTTGDTFDDQKPVWNPNRTVRAVADRYDTIAVCWWNNDPPTAVTTCDGAPTSPAAYDPPTNESNGLIFTVQYKRNVDAGFTSVPSGLAAQRITLTNLVASSDYEIQLLVSDVAANQADEVIVADPVRTLPAGRLYVANQVARSLSVLPDVAQGQGDRIAAVVTTGETQLVAPTGIAVDQDAGLVYVADPLANMIAAYKLNDETTVGGQTVAFEFGEYGIGHNLKPEWTIQGTLTSTDITKLCGPSTLRLELRSDGRKVLYVANSLALPTVFAPVCLPQNILAFDITQAPQGPNQPPMATLEPGTFRGPLGFAVDERNPQNKLLYVANRDDFSPGDRTGWSIQVFGFGENLEDLDSAPHRTFWGTNDGRCLTPESEPSTRICGPMALAYDAADDRLFVVNREKSNILVFPTVSAASGQQTPLVVEGDKTGLDGARPTGIFLDPLKDRVYITTDAGQSVLIFDKSTLVTGGNVAPRRVIKGTKTLLGQPALSPAQSHGPFGVAVVRNDVLNADEAYVVTPGVFDAQSGLTPVPTIAVFNVSQGDPVVAPTAPLSARITNTPPSRVLVNPLLGPTGMALNPDTQRLYVASFYSNMILVYDDADQFTTGLKTPNRIIAGPATLLDHPVALLFRRENASDPGSLYVVNQSSHSVAVFEEGEGTALSPLLTGDVPPVRYLGPPDGTNPFSSDNLTGMVFPTGLAIDPDPDHDILYVSNRDAVSFQDSKGRRIVAFENASSIGPFDSAFGIGADNNRVPTWKIEGDPPPTCATCGRVTDKTTLWRPAGLLLIPDPDTNDTVADDRLVVANRNNNTVLIFRGLSALVGAAQTNPPDDNQAPTWTIANSSLTSPFGLAYNALTKDLYVSDAASRVLAFSLSSLALGTPVPSLQPRVIQGSSTGLLTPLGLALDPQLDP
jgi:DNA-binding beta-propeller fold protein YncE